MTVRKIDYNGRTVSIAELARITGLSYCCLSDRYGKGDRGAHLVRPTFVRYTTVSVAPNQNSDLVYMRAESRQRNEKLRAEHERRQQIEQRRQAVIAAKRAEHAAAFARPLIDASLLTPAERAAIRRAPIGRQHWRSALVL